MERTIHQTLGNKFILGASSNYSYRNTGGEEEVTLQEEHIRHRHGGKLNGRAHTHNITKITKLLIIDIGLNFNIVMVKKAMIKDSNIITD